jgi:ABC-type nitrate/sulfonate/bicarbonate transport system substrate-binding protein
MAKFIIQPHGRLQEWIAHENGYFRDAGLDYELVPGPSFYSSKKIDASGGVADVLSGAFESYKEGGGNKGAKSDISCACHWTVNQAAVEHIGTMWGKSYVVTPGGIMVPPDSPITRPENLAGQEVAVGYRSGSHYATVQALEAFLRPDDIRLKFVGSQWARVDIGIDRDVPGTSVWGVTYQVLEQLGFRKIVDISFMIAFMFPASVDPADVEKYMDALKRAQMDLDLAPEKYKHLYVNEIPERYRTMIDVRRFSTGERIVFLPYGEATFRQTQDWIHARGIFPQRPASPDYASAVAV